jgi:catechol 2,3-dioxygenase-like lactoylglutathione lyase family enzyme
MILDNVGFGVSDYERAKAFYDACLAPLGIERVMEVGGEDTPSGAPAVGYGRDGKPELWLGGEGKTTPPAHVAFLARSRAEVDAFHAAALAAGGTDNGAPGLRPQYHANYYGAFVLDPDGHNMEAVCHSPQ